MRAKRATLAPAKSASLRMTKYSRRRRELPPYLVLLRVGFALPASLLPRRCALTAPFHPYPAAVVNACHPKRSASLSEGSERAARSPALFAGEWPCAWHASFEKHSQRQRG